MEKSYSWAINLQEKVSSEIITYDTFHKIENICGVDVSYKNDEAYCSAVITNTSFDVKDSVNLKCPVKYPYIQGLLFLRESGPLLSTLKLLNNGSNFDVLLIDGHGILHPRKCGLASYVGYMINKPTIGVAKNLLCGSIRQDHFIEYDKTVLGYEIKKEGKKSIYVSIGHKISLKKAIQTVQKVIKEKERLPEPLRIADINSKTYLNFA